VRARLEALDLLVTCKRCAGTGRYEQNPLDKTCYGCAGRGKRLPPLTARLAASVRERQDRGDLAPHYARLSEIRRAATDAVDPKLAQEIAAYVAAGR